MMLRTGLIKNLLLITVTVVSVSPVASYANDDVLNKLKLNSENPEQNDVNALKAEILIGKTEKKAISQLEKLIKKYRGSYMEADLLLRLAELYMRRAKSALFFEINRQSEDMVSLMPKKVTSQSSKTYVKKAISIYDKIQARFPNFASMDMVLFNEAMACQQVGYDKKAVGLYWKLINNHKNSLLVPDAYLAIGEIDFKNKKFDKALARFNSIKKYPNSRAYPYALYKAGWSHYNLRDTMSAMKEMENVVDYGVMIEEQGIDARLDLRKEALSDMALFFSDIFEAKQAYSYFKKQAGKLTIEPYLIKIAKIYNSHSKYKEEEIVLKDFISNLEKSKSIPEVRNYLVFNYEASRDRKKAVQALQEFDSTCKADSSWSQAHQKDKETLNTCTDIISKTSLQLASKWLRMWKKNSTYPIFADSSEAAFRVYLSRPLNTDKYFKSRYVYAELLFNRKKYRKASEQYQLVMNETLDSKKVKDKNIQFVPKKFKKMSHDAHYAAAVGLEKDVEKSGDKKWSEADENLFRKLVAKYLEFHPKGKHHLDLKYKEGLIAFEKANYDYAQKIFYALGDQFNSKDKGIKAQDLYLDILNKDKKFEDIKQYTQKLIAKTKNKKRIAKLKSLYEQSYFLQVQNLEEKKEFEKAIAGYQKFAKENTDSPLAPKAWWNSVQIYYDLDRIGEGAEDSLIYAKMFPKEDNVQEALLQAAKTYEDIGRTHKAAEVLLQLADNKTNADKTKKDDWKLLASDFLILDRSFNQAKEILNQLFSSKDIKLQKKVLERVYHIAKVKSQDLEQKYRKFAFQKGVQPIVGELHLKTLEGQFNDKNYPKAFSTAMDILKYKNASSETKAKARFIQAQILFDEFEKQSLKSQIDRVAMVIAIKTEKLEKAQSAYQSTIRYQDPEMTVKSMMALADLYSVFVKQIKEMPLPSGLNEADALSFRSEMNNLIFPMEDQIIESLTEAKEVAKKLNFYDGTLSTIQSKIDKFNMKSSVRHMASVTPPQIVVPTGGSK